MAGSNSSTTDPKVDRDLGQYSRDSIEKYELAYGRHFVSPGGREASRALIERMALPARSRVLDVGCGLGGSAFLMAELFDFTVDAIDLSHNMIAIAKERINEFPTLVGQVHLWQGDCMTLTDSDAYDGIYSRDVFLHIKEKSSLFAVLFRALNAHGILLFTDYCCSEGPWDPSFSDYVEQRGYHLCTVEQYESLLRKSGFEVMGASDVTESFIRHCEEELKRIETLDPNNTVRQGLVDDWIKKIARARGGNQRWGLFMARKPGAA
ncbi:MAG: methyltransferase domain-containing protein [Gammaproteobacteria bacterium]